MTPHEPPRGGQGGSWGAMGGPLVGVRDPHPYNASILDHHSLDRHLSSSPQILPTCSQLNWLHSSTPMLETLVSWRWWIL